MNVAWASLSGVLAVVAGTSASWSARYRPARSGCANSRVSRIPTLTWGLGGLFRSGKPARESSHCGSLWSPPV